MNENRPLEELAARLSDGEPIDWDREKTVVENAEEQAVLKELRTLHSVIAAHRTIGRDPDDEIPRTWGSLEIVDTIGRGAFGEVLRARDTRLDRIVALKLMRPRANVPPGTTDQVLGSLLREGRHLARVRHPNVVAVYGAEFLAGWVGVWMEYVQGHTLSELMVAKGPFDVRDAAAVGIALCGALRAVHDARLLHLDVKPGNVMREASGRVVLMDFGAGRDLASIRLDPRLLAGTPPYIAPELFRGEVPTARADLYSLGALLFHLSSGALPIEGKNFADFIRAHGSRTRRHLAEAAPRLPVDFVVAVERALAWDPADRFQSAEEMEQALRATLR